MENLKRAIVLDMDETLEKGISDESAEPMMMLRPHLDELIKKLEEAKSQGIDIVLCTTATQLWVERFLALKPEFRDIFDKMLTRDNEKEWQEYSEETHPLEYEAKLKDINIGNGKPVTTFGYDSVLFIDDIALEGERLKSLFEITQGKLEKDVTFFTGYGYWPPAVYDIFSFVEAAKKDEEISKRLPEYLKSLRNENGCLIMCSVIDDFMQKEYKAGLTLVDDKYKEDHQQYKKQNRELSDEIEEKVYDLQDELNIDFFDLIYKDADVKARYESFFTTDKHYPYEGIEDDNKEKLASLVETATEKQEKLKDAQELLKEYQQQELNGEQGKEMEQPE